jgi:hypothetical protein
MSLAGRGRRSSPVKGQVGFTASGSPLTGCGRRPNDFRQGGSNRPHCWEAVTMGEKNRRRAKRRRRQEELADVQRPRAEWIAARVVPFAELLTDPQGVGGPLQARAGPRD